LLAVGAMLVGVAAAAIIVANLAIAAGADVRPADALFAEDLGAMLPFIVTFAALDVATAAGLAIGRTWAVVSATVLALGAATMGGLALAIVLLGGGPGMLTGANPAANPDGLAIIAAFTGLYVGAALALRVDGLPSSSGMPALA
jgi:hypothetical protein